MVENDGKRLISTDSSVNTSVPFAPNRKWHTHTQRHEKKEEKSAASNFTLGDDNFFFQVTGLKTLILLPVVRLAAGVSQYDDDERYFLLVYLDFLQKNNPSIKIF